MSLINLFTALPVMAACVFVAAPAPCFGQVARETWQPPEKIMDAIGVRPGMRIGEAGAGQGYFTFPLARQVGPGGVVFANDISTSSLDVIRERAGREGLGNIKTVVGAVEDPLFPEKNLEMVVMVYVLHSLERPVPFLKNLRSYLKPGGLLVIIERNTTVERTHTPTFMTNRQILETMSGTGYELDRTETFLPRDTIYIFKKLKTADLRAGEIHKAADASLDYLGQPSPGATPQVFARGVVSTDNLEHSAPAFSPDGNEVFWSLWRRPEKGEPQVIMTMRREGGTWSAPAVAPFSGKFVDGGPVFSADGRRIYFYSTRPTPAGKTSDDIWFVEKQDNDWGEPQCLGFVARFPEMKSVYQPSITRNGTLYFISRQKDTPPNEFLIYRAELINGEYPKPELLPQSINAPDAFVNWTPFIAPDESYLLFSSGRRDPGRDYGDLYISRRLADGSWTDPVSLGEPVNSPKQERLPMVSRDGKYLFFTRWTPDYDQDVFWVSTAAIPALRPMTNPSQENPK